MAPSASGSMFEPKPRNTCKIGRSGAPEPVEPGRRRPAGHRSHGRRGESVDGCHRAAPPATDRRRLRPGDVRRRRVRSGECPQPDQLRSRQR